MAIDTTDPRCGGPAFPSGDGEYSGGPNHVYGMSLRDYFAGRAINAVASRWQGTVGDIDESCAAHLAQMAYRIADAMLAERVRK